MRFTSAILILSTVYASASAAIVSRQSLPNCAAPCLSGSSVNYGGCSPQDNKCLCNSQTFVQSSTACIQSSCTGDDLTNAEELAQSLCAAIGVTLSSSAPSSTGSSSASSTASSAASTTSAASATANSARSNGINAVTGLAAFAGVAA
ncbi:hypothetical protein PLICRDRAFT_84951, partial [Plicaturopsis crispa FD-325 SS-3]